MDLISLSQWLKKFPEVSLASTEQSKALLDLFNLTPMKGDELSLTYDRAPDYFAFLRCHSPFHFVLVINDNHQIKATGSLIIRPGLIKGERRWVGYLGDLRVQDPRKWGRFWRRFYKALMQDAPLIEEFKGTLHWQTCLLSDNQKAKKALIDSEVLGYTAYSSYQMNNLILKSPFAPRTKLNVMTAQESDFSELKKFYQSQYKKRDFGYVFDDDFDELSFRLKTWPSLSKRSLILVKDGDSILGATLLWNPGQVKKIMIQRLPGSLKIAGHILRIITPWPSEKEELSCLYPTLFQVKDDLSSPRKNEVAYALLSEALKRRKEYGAHVVSFASFEKEDWSKVLKNFIRIKTNLELLTVDPSQSTRGDYSFYSSPGFEMALV